MQICFLVNYFQLFMYFAHISSSGYITVFLNSFYVTMLIFYSSLSYKFRSYLHFISCRIIFRLIIVTISLFTGQIFRIIASNSVSNVILRYLWLSSFVSILNVIASFRFYSLSSRLVMYFLIFSTHFLCYFSFAKFCLIIFFVDISF